MARQCRAYNWISNSPAPAQSKPFGVCKASREAREGRIQGAKLIMAAATVGPIQALPAPSPYHFGEVEVQDRVGSRDTADRIGPFLRKYLNDQAKEFFNELTLLFVGQRAPDGSIWATTLSGVPGFMKATDDHHLTVNLKQIYADPVKFAEGDRIGSVGVMLHNRRRNRLNCIVESVQPGSCSLKVLQSFGNCPKYIQVRHIVIDEKQLATLGEEERPVAQGTTVLGPEQRAFIARSDTFFMATGFFGDTDGAKGETGCDCNHRGGVPGFVQVTGDGTLRCPDYVGNNMFTSWGNVVVDPHVGIQFIDFDNGDSLQLTGHAQILWDDRSLPGAQRTLEFVTSRWVHVKGGLPIRTEGPVQLSPYNPLPDTSGSSVVTGLKVVSRHNETPDIVTFTFEVPKRSDGKPFCEAGQFASFDFPDLKKGETLNRTWTISSPPKQIAATGRFTISVKKAGLVSTHLHEKVTAAKELVFRGVDGDFTLDRAAKCIPPAGVLLIAGGIGITPMRTMFAECIERDIPVTLLYSVRLLEDAAFLAEFQEGAAAHPNVSVALTLTAAKKGVMEAKSPGVTMLSGRISPAMILQVCPDVLEREVFQCGPDAMMSSALKDLESLGLSSTKVHQESFAF
ncbi:probable flavohemoprotein at C-terminar half [Coccomyxa sp. Obi]|nr:probable flavohemoprotein at C-terminar half [Coccomyxa sp. Obi]